MKKIIYILWLQGFDNPPDVVNQCINSWEYYNPSWKIILIDNKNLNNYIEFEEFIDKSLIYDYTALSDIIRILLLKKYGGLWVDATTFCNKPLDNWLLSFIKEGFFAFNKPTPDRLLSTWFIYAEKENYIIDLWFNQTLQYIKINKKPHTYFWFHYLFENCYNKDTKFKEIWNNVPKLHANGLGPHYLQEKGFFNHLNKDIKENIDNKITPLFKLTYKCKFPHFDENLNLYYLYSSIKKDK